MAVPASRLTERQRTRQAGATPILEARGVTLRYRGGTSVVTATEGIDLEVAQGDRVILLGLLVENLVFRPVERRTVRRWGMVR